MEFIAEESGEMTTTTATRFQQEKILSQVMMMTTMMKMKNENKEEKVLRQVDLSGMSLNSLSNPSLNLSLTTKLDLSNNNLKVN